MSAKFITNPEVVVVGGGLAGSAAAIVLARSGIRVTLLEREAQPAHKVCGEFLSEEAVEALLGLGIHPDALAAPAVNRLRVSGVHRVFETALPFRAYSLSRRLLDEALLRNVEETGGQVLRGQHVTELRRDGDAWRVQLRSGESIAAANVMLATGKHDITGLARPQGKQNDMIGLKQYFRLQPEQQQALEACIELHLFPGGYAGLQLVEDGTANLCCAAHSSELEKGAAMWPSLLEQMKLASSLLRTRLEGAVAVLDKPLAIAPIPYGMVQSKTQNGLWLLGDQAAVIPSYTGDGMSMALHSGILAASALMAGENSQAFQQRYALAVRRQVGLATWISRRMVHPREQRWIAALLRLSPSLLRWVATQTRLPQGVRQNALQAIATSSRPAANSSAQYGKARA